MLIGFLTSAADNCRYVSMTSTGSPPTVLQIQQGETAELLSGSNASGGNNFPLYTVQKDGITCQAFPRLNVNSGNSAAQGTTVTGPATITVLATSFSGSALLTVKITPDSYDVNKTLILPPGTNQVYISLESSTNLVNWADSTNGIYGSPDTARFFRIRMNTLASP